MTTIAALKKVSLDQFIVAPFIMLVFYPFTAFFNGRPMNEAVDDLKSKYWATLVLNYKIWPAASLINFLFLPIQYQVLWANFVSLGFIACLSFLANSK